MKRTSKRNRLANLGNKYQGSRKRVLCLCSAGMLRSPTAAVILASEFGCNTRAAGLTDEYALIPVDDALLTWADEVVVMDKWQMLAVGTHCEDIDLPVPVIHNFDIPDEFEYMQDELVAMIRQTALTLKFKRETK